MNVFNLWLYFPSTFRSVCLRLGRNIHECYLVEDEAIRYISSELHRLQIHVTPSSSEGFGRAKRADFQKSSHLRLANDFCPGGNELWFWPCYIYVNYIVRWMAFISPSMRRQELFVTISYTLLHPNPVSLLTICPPFWLPCNICGLVGAGLLNWKNIIFLNMCAYKHMRTL